MLRQFYNLAIRKILRCFFLTAAAGIIIAMGATFAIAATRKEGCGDSLAEVQEKALTAISRIERDYLSASWNEKKFRETLYGPLWDSWIQQSDSFSAQRRAEGEVLYARYQSLAASQSKRAHEDLADLSSGLEAVRTLVFGLYHSCPSITYQNCVENWKDRTLMTHDELEKLAVLIRSADEALNQKVLQTMNDSPSDHDKLQKRILGIRSSWEFEFDPEMIRLLRIMEEQWLNFLPNSCCDYCERKDVERFAGSKYLHASAEVPRLNEPVRRVAGDEDTKDIENRDVQE